MSSIISSKGSGSGPILSFKLANYRDRYHNALMNNNNDIVPVTKDQQIGCTYADTARVMTMIAPDFGAHCDGFDWDSWKDEMKERDL